MELTDLRYFYNVATSRSFAQGAKLSCVTPPAISKAVKKLEAELGTPLLVRTTRRVSLTDRGAIVLAHCKQVLDQIEALQRAMAEAEPGPSGELRVAANEVFSTYLLPSSLARLVREYPAVQPRCYEMIPQRMAHWLGEGRLDVGFTIGADGLKGVDVHTIAVSPGVLVCGPGHPLFEAGSVDADLLAQHPMVVPRFFEREYLQALDQFPVDRFRRRVGCTIELLQMAIQLCMDGAYLGYFPEVSVRCQLNHDELRALDGLGERKPFELVALTRHGATPRAAAARLIDELRVTIAAAAAPICLDAADSAPL